MSIIIYFITYIYYIILKNLGQLPVCCVVCLLTVYLSSTNITSVSFFCFSLQGKAWICYIFNVPEHFFSLIIHSVNLHKLSFTINSLVNFSCRCFCWMVPHPGLKLTGADLEKATWTLSVKSLRRHSSYHGFSLSLGFILYSTILSYIAS